MGCPEHSVLYPVTDTLRVSQIRYGCSAVYAVGVGESPPGAEIR